MNPLILAMFCFCTSAEVSNSNGHPLLPLRSQEWVTASGQVARISIEPADAPAYSSIRVGEQFMEFRAAPLYHVLQMSQAYMAPCPRTPYNFGKVPEVLQEYEDAPYSCEEALYETVDFYASCSNCQLEDLQDVVVDFLQRELWLLPASALESDERVYVSRSP